MAAKRQLPALTGMRCFLALWVAVYHQFPQNDGIRISWLPHAPDAVYCILRTGYIAVTIFFVLSGFVLSYNYDLGVVWSRKGVMKFGIARFSRIYPAYFLGLLLLVPFAIYRIARTFSPATLGLEGGVAFLNWSLLQSWIPQTAQTWNFPGWSLSDEAFFYACFPLVGVALWRLSRFRSLLVAGLFLWVLSVLAPLWAVVQPIAGFGDVPASTNGVGESAELWANLVRYNPLLRLPEFCVGILLGRAYSLVQKSGGKWFGKGSWLYLPSALATMVLLSYSDSIPYPLVHNGLLLPLYACVLFGLALDGGLVARVLSSKTLVFLGNASYSMYILHAPIASWMHILWRDAFLAIPEGPLFVACYTAAVVLASCAVYKFFEEPLNRFLKRRLMARLERREKLPVAVAAGPGP